MGSCVQHLPLLTCFCNLSQLLQAAGIAGTARFLSEFILPCGGSCQGHPPSPTKPDNSAGFSVLPGRELRRKQVPTWPGRRPGRIWGPWRTRVDKGSPPVSAHTLKTCLQGGVNIKASVLGSNPFERRLSVTTHRRGWSRACV